MAEERILLKVEFDSKTAQKRVIDLQTNLREQQNELSKLTASYKAGLISEQAYSAEQLKLQSTIKSLKQEQNDLIKSIELETVAMTANAGSREQLASSLALAQKELARQAGSLRQNADGTIELTESYKKASEQVKKAKDAIIAFDKGVSDGRSSVGLYEEALNKAGVGTGVFGISFEKLGEIMEMGADKIKKTVISTLQNLWTTMLANPIIAIVAGFVALVSIFVSTEKGANKLQEVFARFKPLFDAIYSAVASVGEILFTVIDTAGKAFSYLSSFFSDASENSAKLTVQLQNVNKALIEQEAIDKKMIAREEELKKTRDNELIDTKERLRVNAQIGELEIKRISSTLKLEEEKADVLRKQYEQTSENLRTSEQLKAVAEQDAKVADLRADIAGKQTEQITNQVGLSKELLETQIEISDLQLSIAKLSGKIAEGSEKELKIRKRNLDKQLKGELDAITNFDFQAQLIRITGEKNWQNYLAKSNDKAKLAILKNQEGKLQLDKEFNDKQKENYESFVETQKELRDKAYNDEIAGLKLRVIKTIEGTQERLEAETTLIKRQAEIEIAQGELVGNELKLKQAEALQGQLDLYKKFYDDKEAKRKEDIEKDKQARIEVQQINVDSTNIALQQETLRQQGITDIQNVSMQERLKNRDALLTLEQEQAKKQFDLEIAQANDSAIKKEQAQINYTNKIIEISKKRIDFVLADLRIENTESQLLLNEKELALDKTIENENLRNIKKLELRATFAETLRTQEQEIAFANLQSELQFTALSDTQKAEAQQRYRQALLDIDKKYTEGKVQLDEARKKSEEDNLQSLATIFGESAKLFKENTIAYKALAIGQAVISTYLAANKAFAEGGGFPVGAILAGITVAQGLLNVAKIADVEFAKGGLVEFARGGRVIGAGTGTSDSINAKLSNGEAVLNANAMRANDVMSLTGTPREIASTLNSSYGGVQFAHGGALDFLNPNVLQPVNDNVATSQNTQGILNVLANQELFISVVEIDKVQSKVRVTEQRSSS